jgi:hypothetical protein
MDRRSASPEDLPPLELRTLRELDVAEPSTPGGRAHISAASGIVRRGTYAYVIGDDELSVGVFDLSTTEPGTLRRALPGDLPADEGARKREKPDLEALTALPPIEQSPHGGLLGIGSGSDPSRDRAFFWALEADGSLHGEPWTVDFHPVYEELRRELGNVNIEGAAVFHDCLWLFNRGNEAGSHNAVAEVSIRDLSTSIHGDREVEPDELVAVREYELGQVEGVRLCFSDATTLLEGLVAFTASAEGADGDIHGSLVGTIDSEGEVRRLRTIDRRWKVEGVHATVDSGVVDLVFVCDQDDPDVPSPLLSGTMPLEGRFEREEA